MLQPCYYHRFGYDAAVTAGAPADSARPATVVSIMSSRVGEGAFVPWGQPDTEEAELGAGGVRLAGEESKRKRVRSTTCARNSARLCGFCLQYAEL